MMILSNNQLYDAVKETADGLEGLGMKDQADELRAALSISSLPGEILGEIRLALQRIDLRVLPKVTEYQIVSEKNYIDSVLG
jgi:hypothetical protein